MSRCLDRLITCTVISFALTWAGAANALPEDRTQPIHIAADQALRDEKQGFTRYRGNVKLDQGSLHIEAEQITVYHVGQQADRILATGTPARLQQQPEADKGLIKAKADNIEYIKSEQRVELRKNAHIEQEGSIVTGNSIDYLMDEQLVRAESAQGDDTNRVQVVIPAQVLEQQETASGTTDSQ